MTPELVTAHWRPRGQFADPGNTAYLAEVLEGRLVKDPDRYLTRLSPIANHVEDGAPGGTDLAARRAVRDPALFRFRASTPDGRLLPVVRRDATNICVPLVHQAPDGGAPDDDASRYVRVAIEDGVARGPLLAYLYDLGPARGFQLVGLERPE